MEKNKYQCSLSDVSVSTEPNKMIITGCITKIGTPSSSSPCGASGKKLVFTQKAIDACMETFVGMPLDCVYDDAWDKSEIFTYHGETNIGYIRKVWVDSDKLMAEAVVWKEKFVDGANMILLAMDSLGFSIEAYLTEKHENDEYIYADKFEGSGCAILFKDCAAFSDTFIEKIAAAKNRSDNTMNEQEKQEFTKQVTEAVMAAVDKKFEEQDKAIDDKIKAAVEDIKGLKDVVDEVKDSVEKLGKVVDEVKAKQGEIKASAVPAPKSQKPIDDPSLEGGKESKADRIAKINAADSMSMMEKLEAIAKIRREKE